MVEEDGSNVVEMAVQGEQAAPGLVRPDLDFVVITTRNKQGLRLVKVDASNGAIVLFEAIDQSTHTVVPELNRRRVEGDKDPWSIFNVRSITSGKGRCRGNRELPAGEGWKYRLGWKAMPFAREDLDSNCICVNRIILGIKAAWSAPWSTCRTLVRTACWRGG